MKIFSIALLLCTAGCIFREAKQSPPPLKPETPFELREKIQTSADIADKIATIAVTSGIGRHSYESTTLKGQTENLRLVLGNPVDPIEYTDNARVRALTVDIRKLEAQHRKALVDWEDTVRELATNREISSKLYSENSSLKSRLIFWMFVAGVLVFVFPTIGVPAVFWVIKRARKLTEVAVTETSSAMGRQFSQVVRAIEDHKKELEGKDPVLLAHLKMKLREETDTATRELISKLKNHA